MYKDIQKSYGKGKGKASKLGPKEKKEVRLGCGIKKAEVKQDG